VNHELRIKYGTSRAANTYGYGLVSLYDGGKKVAACNGGGYDMRGTVFGEWLEKTYQERLVALAKATKGAFARANWNGELGDESNYVRLPADRKVELYGGTYYENGSRESVHGRKGAQKYIAKPPHVTLDGGCGFESIYRIAKAIGLNVRTVDAGKKLDILLIEDTKPG